MGVRCTMSNCKYVWHIMTGEGIKTSIWFAHTAATTIIKSGWLHIEYPKPEPFFSEINWLLCQSPKCWSETTVVLNVDIFLLAVWRTELPVWVEKLCITLTWNSSLLPVLSCTVKPSLLWRNTLNSNTSCTIRSLSSNSVCGWENQLNRISSHLGDCLRSYETSILYAIILSNQPMVSRTLPSFSSSSILTQLNFEPTFI